MRHGRSHLQEAMPRVSQYSRREFIKATVTLGVGGLSSVAMAADEKHPPTDAARAQMIHSFRWSRQAKLELSGVAKGVYAVYAYVWEETDPENLRILLNGEVVEGNYYTGRAGRWRRLGPWIKEVGGGKIVITATGGAANFSGIEIWRRRGK